MTPGTGCDGHCRVPRSLCSGLRSGHPVRPAAGSGQHLGGHRAGHCAVLPASPHLRGSSPPQAPPLVLRLGPCQRCQAEPTGGGVPAPQEGRFGPTALLGAARPPRCRLPASCCHSVSAKGESRYRIRACSTSSPALVLLRGGFGPAHPEVASWAGGGRSGLSVWPQDGTRPPQPSQLREATVTRARPSTPLLQAQPALLPVLFLKEFLVLFQCRGLCTVLIPRFPSLFYCTIMAVAGSWCNMEVL